MRLRPRVLTAVVAAALLVPPAGAALALAARGRPAGPRADGTAVLPVGYRVTPAGDRVTLGNMPLDSAVSPDGRQLVVVNAGQGTQSVQVVDVATRTLVQTLPYVRPSAVYAGVAFSPDGSRLYVSGGGTNVVHSYAVAGGRLTEGTPITLPTTAPGGGSVNLFPAGLAVTPDGAKLVVADQLGDAVSVVTLATGAVSTVAAGHRPYGVTLSRDGRTAWVADQGGTTVETVDVSGSAPVVTGTVAVGTHPARSVLSADGRTLYVANGESDSVSVVDTAARRVVRTLSLAPYRGAAIGSNPDALALGPDGRTLYVANAGNNDVAVLDLRSGRVRGMVPVGWFPTGVHVVGGRIWTASGKGLGAGPNDGPNHPDPYATTPTAENQYSGSMQLGLLTALRVPGPAELARLSAQVVRNNDFDERGGVRTGGPAGAPGRSAIPSRPGAPSPIKHVIYVVKENRTFDQVFGDLGRGNGDPSLRLFGDESAPNTRELARRFATFDNFYADAEVSAGGWNWSTAANSNAFAEQQWPANYSGRRGIYSSENSAEPALVPNERTDDGYVWQRLARAGISFRNYGFYVNTAAGNVNTGTDAVLDAHTNHDFRGYDLSCPDSAGTFTPLRADCGRPRIDVWLDDFRAAERSGDLPAVQFVRLPNDHTAGTRAGSPTPRAYVADNDLALGRLVDAVSHSRFWSSTAILVTEDDAQNGPDHVDAHRTLALAVSPYTQRGSLDSTFYSTASMLRTLELVAGIGPLTQFDAYATPMSAAFTGRPSFAPYTARVPTTPLGEVNSAAAPLAAVSAAQDLSVEDRIDERAFNEAIWQSVKGAGSPMPAPRHAAGAPADDD